MPEPGRISKRQEIWEEEYRKHPYLAGKPEAHLVESSCYLSKARSPGARHAVLHAELSCACGDGRGLVAVEHNHQTRRVHDLAEPVTTKRLRC